MLMTVNETAIHEKNKMIRIQASDQPSTLSKTHTVRDTIKGPCMTNKKPKQTYPYLCLNQAKK